MSFPILLITFIFALQVIQIYTFDILGTYAAYAAARSYSVFRNHAPLAGGNRDARQNAALLARDVAAAVLALYSVPRADELDRIEKTDVGMSEGAVKYWNLMERIGFTSSDPEHKTLGHRTAIYRMSGGHDGTCFRIREYGADGVEEITVSPTGEVRVLGLTEPAQAGFALFLREGYGYIDDLADLIVRTIITPQKGLITINAGSGVGHSVKEVIILFFDLLGKKLPIENEERPVFIKKSIADVEYAKKLFGWYHKTDLREGISSVLKSKGFI